MAAQIAVRSIFQIALNGIAVDSTRIAYAGAAPGFAGLYQINVLLPDGTPSSPEIRIGTPDQMSPAGRYLPVR